jgi:bile acid:Na+ symporter, BASS family
MDLINVLILLALVVSILLTMFSLGLSASLEDAIYLFRRPGELCRSLVSMYVLMPVFAVLVVLVFALSPSLEIALVALMVSPMSPLLPKKALRQGGTESYTIGLLVAAGVLAIVTVPLSVFLIGSVSGASVAPFEIAKTVAITVLFPLAAGLLIRHLKPAFAGRIERPLTLGAAVLLIAAIVPMLIIELPIIVQLVFNGAVIAILMIVIAGLAAGHLLGGPVLANRMVLALTTTSRHPGVAMAIVMENFADQRSMIFAGILLYLLVSAIIVISYQKWFARTADMADVSGQP